MHYVGLSRVRNIDKLHILKLSEDKIRVNPTLIKAKVWERYGKVWAIYDPYVGMIWDSVDIMWDWYGV